MKDHFATLFNIQGEFVKMEAFLEKVPKKSHNKILTVSNRKTEAEAK
jgi:hypothetical protein